MLKKMLLVLLVVILGSSIGFAGSKDDGGQSIVKFGENIEITRDMEVETAVSIGGSITVYGKVLEDVVAVGGSIDLKNSALVGGDVVSVGGGIEKAPGAIIKGDIVEASVPGIAPMISACSSGDVLKGWAAFSILSFIAFLVLVAILVALFGPQLGAVSERIEKELMRTFLFGLLACFLFVPIIILLVISFAGIILIPVWAVLAAIALLFGYIAAAHFIGRKVLAAFKVTKTHMMAETLTGVVLLALVGLVPVIGFIIKAVVGCMGLGSVVLTRFGMQKG
jgi:hypothetical protein